MKHLFLVFALFVAVECHAQVATNLDFRYPVRAINGQRVDLRYLFQHWHSKANAITNSRWVLLTGSILDDNAGGWVVDGKTESASGLSFHQKVLVVNPPRAEKQTLDTLLAQQHGLKKEDSALQSKEISLEYGTPQPATKHHHAALPANPANIPQQEASISNKESSVQNELTQLDKELAVIPTTETSTGKVYRVDFFVFATGQAHNGMPLLDFGTPTR
jgi:hypothetical protein